MSVVFMKVLEKRPARYDAGLARLSGADWPAVRGRIAAAVKPGDRVLEIGCGPGTLAVELARAGARVTAIDRDPGMLTFARGQAAEAGAEVDFRELSAERLRELEGPFDLVVASLSFSELRPIVRQAALVRARGLLAAGGRVIVVDEAVPERGWPRLRYCASRALWSFLTWIITRKGTSPLAGFGDELAHVGYNLIREEALDSGLRLWEAVKAADAPAPSPPALAAGWSVLDWPVNLLLWLTSHLLRVPVRPGLYRIGSPGPDSPLLATCNYRLTVNMLRLYLKGRDAWLLVNDTRGVNVWCSAGEGNFSAQEIALTLEAARAAEHVSRREVVLPKLGFNGVRLRDVKTLSGFRGRVGPVYARDLPAYLDGGGKKTDAMEKVRFDLFDRLWFGVPFAVLVSFFAAVVTLVLPLPHSTPLWFGAVSLLAAAAYSWLPTRWHLVKGSILGALLALAAAAYLHVQAATAMGQFRAGALMFSLALFVTADFSGSTPVSNKSLVEREFKLIYGVLALVLVVYFALPRVMEVMSW